MSALFPRIGPYSVSAALPPLPARQPEQLLQCLVRLQHHCGHLDETLLRLAADHCGVTLATARSVASFYTFLRQTTPVRYRILLSDNIVDRMAGQQDSLDTLKQTLADMPGIVIDTTACIGLSDHAPAALVNGTPVTRLTPERARALADCIRNDVPMQDWPAEWFAIDDHLLQTDLLLNEPAPHGDALRAALAQAPESLLDAIEHARLTGRGGAGYPTALKWRAARDASGTQKYVVCNADEGEPGTFKDRVLLTRHADALIEGMTLGAWAIGASHGFIYLRGEYAWLYDALETALETRRAQGLLGDTILGTGFTFDIELHLGAGAYICGEESALIESLEGRRGTPRKRPPFPVTAGYRQCPTVVNNVETWISAAWIARHGADAFRQRALTELGGTKLHSISGDVTRPGIYEFPVGTSLRTLLDAAGAQDAAFVQLGGPSGHLLFARDFDVAIDLQAHSTGGSLMVFGPHRSPLEVIRNFAHFFAHESCGFCTPCRAGAPLIARQLDAIAEHRAHPDVHRDLKDLIDVIHTTSHCGLGHTLGNAVLDVYAEYPQLDPGDSRMIARITPS